MSLKYQIVPVTAFEQNCTLLWCSETMKAAVVDPGGDIPRILAAIKSLGIVPERLLITHGHIDHAGGAAELAERLSVPFEGPQIEDAFWINGMPEQSKLYGFPGVRSFTPDRWLAQGDMRVTAPEALSTPESPADAAPWVLAGNAFATYGERLPAALAGLARVEAWPTATALLDLAPPLLAAGGAVDAAQALPLYIRDKVAQTTAERLANGGLK